MSKAAAKPRSKAAPKVKEALPSILPRKVIVSGPQKQVFIIDDADKLTDITSLQCISLVHPKHGKPCRYLHTSSDVWEVQRVYQPPSSWLLQHEIQEDGSFYLCTRIDPLFLVLPLLDKGRKKTADHEGNFMQLDQLLPRDQFPLALLSAGGGAVGGSGATAHTLCDLRDGWNEPVLRLSDAKVVAWLRGKVRRLQQSMKGVPSLRHLYSPVELTETLEQTEEREAKAKAKADDTSAESEQKEGEESATAAATPTPVKTPLSAPLRQSLQFVSEYLSPPHFALLLSSYSLVPEDVFERKRAAVKSYESSGSKISGDIDTSRPAGVVPTSDLKRKTDKPISAAAKKLASAAKGTKSLASFFAKKT